ncbi:unnamed protein product [Rotaria socialis]|uniref:Non-canonical purine NTP phosphatase/PRRC1 domain-containing protein n=1 Tax=Rotaria socialis TaxID=392032 RepID=A0A818GRU8_9BILA|nr:unnamed protein product [Rotaria socialis]CAF4506225.1 unnamed protein product [Rotaria socialis]
MENIALSDSNDELADDTIGDNDLSQGPPRMLTEQLVTSELQDAANTDVTKASFTSAVNTPFKPLFPAPTSVTRSPSTGSPLLFQQRANNIPTLNPLFQSPISTSQFSSPLLQPSLRPPMVSNPFESPPSAFTPLNPANTQQSLSSLIQPKLTIGNQPMPSVSLSQSIPFPMPTTQGIETTNIPPPMMVALTTQDIPKAQNTSQFVPAFPLPPGSAPSTAMKEPNFAMPPPSQQFGTTAQVNPYSARASLTERIYPSMPTSQAPLQPQQLPPPVSFQPQQLPAPVSFQQQNIPPPSSNVFVPPPAVVSSAIPNAFPGLDTNIYNPSYQSPGEPNPTPWTNYPTSTFDQQQNDPMSPAHPSGVWGWISNNKMLATVVEKARTGLETVITTVDPQMKQYIQPGHEINIVVTSAKDIKLTPVRDAFTQVFGRVITQGIGVQSNVAPQPVGFEAGFKGAQQRIENLRRQNVVRPDQCVVSIENFIAELVPDMYFDLGYVLLSDPLNSIELHLFTQAIPIPIEYVYQARDRTPADYPLKWSGYMVTIGEILHSQLPFVNPEDWHEMMSGTSRRDIIYATCKSLAYMYKQRLNRKQ